MSPGVTSTIEVPNVHLPATDRLRIGVLASGRGSNLQSLINGAATGEIPARVVAVASNRPNALALQRAQQAHIEARSFPRSQFKSRADQESAIVEFLQQNAVEIVVLAGYVPVLGTTLLGAFCNRIVNIHPSLLPSFGGTLHGPAAALDHGVKISGCTVHFVTDEVDGGPIIVQRSVPVFDDDTEESLAERILAEEHQALPEAIRLIAAGRVVISGRRTRILPST